MSDQRDVIDRLAAAEADNTRLRRLLEEAGVTDTLRHALRDTVAMLRTIMRRSSETATDVESYAAHLEGRLDTLMRIRARTDAFGDADLHLLVSEELAFHLVREGERAVIAGPHIRLKPKAAQVLATAFHELASNAVEHGALDQSEGHVDVTWQVEPESGMPVVRLCWNERGGAIDPDNPVPRRGFGREVLETMLAYELEAQTSLSFEPDGLRCTIRFPFTERVGRLGAHDWGEDWP
ncbi:HWE histidine kinase domain-containing protein [Methylobacterium persicinum]|uniref:histidine kinase n=1 Tax=Methylobacterium persicinum TaxID=374426 RepID=A0ABU0HRF7_9HYPH|nr:HWE histidine kinase domain-containing protein [Methylobacterium persicinum]MDQ0444924.1 two-component sensor histidine kinase [Methylobacterium persicinum]GJE39886.1 Blue-light-activated histidine kinase [Methylobacterium persicinum]